MDFKKLKPKKCKNCGELFTPLRPLQSCCSAICAYGYGRKLKEKKDKKDWTAEKKVLKEKLMTMKDYMKLYQITFNTYIRVRDADLPCVSCGTFKCEEFHAGHYIASTFQYLRFNEKNVWKQCSRCNTHLRGNSIPYRIELINRIGLEEVEYLENSRHMMLELSIHEIKERIKFYKQLTNQLKTKP